MLPLSGLWVDLNRPSLLNTSGCRRLLRITLTFNHVSAFAILRTPLDLALGGGPERTRRTPHTPPPRRCRCVPTPGSGWRRFPADEPADWTCLRSGLLRLRTPALLTPTFADDNNYTVGVLVELVWTADSTLFVYDAGCSPCVGPGCYRLLSVNPDMDMVVVPTSSVFHGIALYPQRHHLRFQKADWTVRPTNAVGLVRTSPGQRIAWIHIHLQRHTLTVCFSPFAAADGRFGKRCSAGGPEPVRAMECVREPLNRHGRTGHPCSLL